MTAITIMTRGPQRSMHRPVSRPCTPPSSREKLNTMDVAVLLRFRSRDSGRNQTVNPVPYRPELRAFMSEPARVIHHPWKMGFPLQRSPVVIPEDMRGRL